MNNILITGSAGFIGSHLIECCVQEGYKVKGFIHYNSRNDWGWLEESKYKNDIEIVSGDIRDYDSVYNFKLLESFSIRRNHVCFKSTSSPYLGRFHVCRCRHDCEGFYTTSKSYL